MLNATNPSRGRFHALAATFALAALLAVSAVPAQAEPIRRLGQNPRGLALGGTGMSYADDEMGLYYNPAGLGSVSRIWVEVLPIAAEASPDGYTFLQDKLSEGDSDVGSLSNLSEMIQDNIDKDLHYRAFAYPTGVFGLGRGLSFGAGIFYETEADIMFHNQASPVADAYYRKDQGGALGFAFPLAEGRFLVGIGGRHITREVGEETISSADLAIAAANDELDLEQELDLQKGSGVAYDLGMIWRIELFSQTRSQIAAVVQNIGGADLGDAGEIPQEVSVGFAMKPQFSHLVRGMFAVEFRDATFEATDDESTDKRTHVGFELGVIPQDESTSLVTGRVGWGQGGISYGLEVALWHAFSIQYVYYEQEYGEGSGEDLRERFILQLNLVGFSL